MTVAHPGKQGMRVVGSGANCAADSASWEYSKSTDCVFPAPDGTPHPFAPFPSQAAVLAGPPHLPGPREGARSAATLQPFRSPLPGGRQHIPTARGGGTAQSLNRPVWGFFPSFLNAAQRGLFVSLARRHMTFFRNLVIIALINSLFWKAFGAGLHRPSAD